MCDSFEGVVNTNIIFTKMITNNMDFETKRLRNVLGLKHIIKHEDFILDVMKKLFFEIICAPHDKTEKY